MAAERRRTNPQIAAVKQPKKVPLWDGGQLDLRTPVMDWQRVDAGVLRDAVEAVTMAGALLMLGVTGTGFAVKIGILDGDARKWWYGDDAEEVGAILAQMASLRRDG